MRQFQTDFAAGGKDSNLYNCTFNLDKKVKIYHKQSDRVMGPDGRFLPRSNGGEGNCFPGMRSTSTINSYQFDYDDFAAITRCTIELLLYLEFS